MRWRWLRPRLHVVQEERHVAARPRTVWTRLMECTWVDGEAVWQEGASFVLWDGTRVKVLSINPPHRLRFHWIPAMGDRSRVEATVALQPNGRTLLRFRHEFAKEDHKDVYRERWRKALDAIAEGLPGGAARTP